MRSLARLGQFADLQPILDAALASGGGTYTLPSYGAAVHWRQRAYKFRKLYATHFASMSKYDQLTMPRIKEGSCDVVINMLAPKGFFQPAHEAPVIEQAFDEDDLLSIAENFAKNLGD